MTFKCAIVDMQCWTCCKCPECRLTDKRTDWQTLTLYKKHIFLWQPRPSKYLCMYIFHIVWPTLRLQILKLFVWPRLCCFRLLHWTSSCCLSSMTILLPLTHSLTHYGYKEQQQQQLKNYCHLHFLIKINIPFVC